MFLRVPISGSRGFGASSTGWGRAGGERGGGEAWGEVQNLECGERS
jgi:hypothetical protein